MHCKMSSLQLECRMPFYAKIFISSTFTRGDVRNRFSQPPLKKFLIPSLTKEKYFLFGRNIFFRSLPRDLCFFSLFSIKLLRAWHFDHISCSNWARTINRYSNDLFRSPEQDKSIIEAVRRRKK